MPLGGFRLEPWRVLACLILDKGYGWDKSYGLAQAEDVTLNGGKLG